MEERELFLEREYHRVMGCLGLFLDAKQVSEPKCIFFYISLCGHFCTRLLCLFLVICHVVGITYQNIEYRLLAEMLGDPLGESRPAPDHS